jgi:NADH-quinone oxidoreductase subunit M
MNAAAVPFLELALLLPWVGAATVAFVRHPPAAARFSLYFLILLLTAAAGIALSLGGTTTVGTRTFAIDAVSAPMLPVLVLLHLLTLLGTSKARVTPALCIRVLLSVFVGLAVVTCQEPWILIGILALATLLPFWELRASGKPCRGFVLYMSTFVVLLGLGQFLVGTGNSTVGFGLIILALGIRGGIVPFHGWVPRLFQNATYASAMLFILPLMEVVAAIRLLLPGAPAEGLNAASIACLVTAIYGGGMAVVQNDVRRFYANLCLSQTSLVLYGVMAHTVNGLTAALCLWVSASISLAALAFSIRAIEARFGRLSLDRHHGHYEQVPGLAVSFLFTGLACVGFPGTVGFLPMELLFAGSVDHGLWVSFTLAIAAMLNGIAILRAYFALFTGRRPSTAIPLPITRLERIGIVLIAFIIFAGAWLPPGIVASRHRVAESLLGVSATAVDH